MSSYWAWLQSFDGLMNQSCGLVCFLEQHPKPRVAVALRLTWNLKFVFVIAPVRALAAASHDTGRKRAPPGPQGSNPALFRDRPLPPPPSGQESCS